MRVDDRHADRQAKSDASGLGRDERRKNPLDVFLGNAAADVSDRDLHTTGVSRMRMQLYLAAGADIGHCVGAIHDEIEQYLLQLDAVALDRRQGWFEIENHFDVAIEQVAADDAQYVEHDVVHVQAPVIRAILAQHRPQPADYLASALVVLDNVGEAIANLV